MRLVSLALTDKGEPVSDRSAASVFQASHWYEAAALPALVGIVEGLLIGGLFRRLRSLDAIAATLIFGVLVFAFAGSFLPSDLASWLGPLLFLFCLAGGMYVVRDIKRQELNA